MAAECVASAKQTMEFQAEVKQLLGIVVNSLYTHKEIFLRELIANASDALEKLRILSLTDPTALEDTPELSIFIEIDSENKTLTISDNGIGMTYDEVVENIGTIARSGSTQFIECFKRESSDDADLDLIGQFGVGFYSAFMVAERVTLLTRAPNQTVGVRWESTGDGTYQIEEAEKRERGTRITLKLKDFERGPNDFDEDFLNQYTIQKQVQKHCNFISYPIRMNFATTEPASSDPAGSAEQSKQVVVQERILNSIQPIWEKQPKDVERDQYLQFYKQQFHDWNEPAEIVHCRGEGIAEFTALLFVPSQAPYGLYTGDLPKGPQLYCKHVMVINDCKELLPDYLRFVRGIVDSPELTLNLSREMLQHSKQLQLIRNHLEKKILDAFKSVLESDREKYNALWSEYGKAIKGGVFMDYKTTEKLQDLLIFESSHSVDQKTTLKEYVLRMKENQKAIYYATGESRSFVERLPQMEMVREKGIEVLYFLDKVDEFLTQHLREYDGKKLQSVARGELELSEPQEESQGTPAQKETQYGELLDFVRTTLKDQVKDVRLSKRLKSSPVCLVSGDSGYTLNMERLMRDANQPIFKATRVLEVNSDHQVIKTLQKLLDSKETERLAGCCQLLYDQTLLIENDKMEDPMRFTDQVWRLIVDAYN